MASSDGNRVSQIAFEIPAEQSEDDSSPGKVHHEASRTSGEVEVQTSLSELHPQLAQRIAKMEVINPEVLRVTLAFHAFESCASALRDADGGRDLYHKSRVSDKISTFWSHSWHGGKWKKIITLIVFYNGFAAMFFGFLTVIAVMVLFALKILPGFRRGTWDAEFSTWSLFGGTLAASLAFLLWHSHDPVFVDRICISQGDSELKAQAIFSLTGLLKKSKTMLILWDLTWAQRLWCLFELAAFLKSRHTEKQALVVRPILLGPMSIAIFLTMFVFAIPFTTVPATGARGLRIYTTYLVPVSCALLFGMAASYWTLSTVRRYFRDLDTMKQQLLTISFDQTLSACCELKHVGPSGVTLLCDRKIVKECVDIWFGSQEAFEDTLRSQVLDVVWRDLSEGVFTTGWALAVTSPILWAFLDLAVSLFVNQNERQSNVPILQSHFAGYVLEGLAIWLLAIPQIKDVLLLICRFSRNRPQKIGLEILKNSAVVALLILQVLLVVCAYLVTRIYEPRLLGTGLFCGILLLASVRNWMVSKCLQNLGRRQGW